MRFLLDTCVISELVKPRPQRSVAEWVREQPEERLFLSVLTLGELSRGIGRLADGRKKRQLATWLQRDLKPRFAGRWLAVDEEVAERWGMLHADAACQGRTMPVIDGLLAATALVHGMTLVTRNDADVRPSGNMILNPWA
jgi:predicted nucleic acid-binding protein